MPFDSALLAYDQVTTGVNRYHPPAFDVVVNRTDDQRYEDPLLNPYIDGEAEVGGEVVPLSKMSEAELRILNNEFTAVVSGPRSNYGLMLLDNANAVLTLVRMAKKRIDGNPVFMGSMANHSQLGLMKIESQHIFRTTGTTETPKTQTAFSFTQTAEAGASTAWLGYGTSNASAVNIDKRAALLLCGLYSYSPNPVIEKMIVTHGPTTYMPELVGPEFNTQDSPEGVAIARITPRYLMPKDTIKITTTNLDSGTQRIGFVGVTCATGSYFSQNPLTSVML